MELIDTHCHLYAEEFRDDIDALISRAKEAGVTRFFLPAVDKSSHQQMLNLEMRYPGTCYAMIGLHPCSVNANYEAELKSVEDYASTRAFVAIGEIGLDYHWDLTFKEQQLDAFHRQVELAITKNLPIVIHSRNSIDECIHVVSQYPSLERKGIFHCFSGTQEQAEKIVAQGFYLGIGGVITYKNSGLGLAVKDVPLENLVLETDAPYLAPVPYRGKRNESGFLTHIAAKLAEVKRVTVEEVAVRTTANAQKIFGR